MSVAKITGLTAYLNNIYCEGCALKAGTGEIAKTLPVGVSSPGDKIYRSAHTPTSVGVLTTTSAGGMGAPSEYIRIGVRSIFTYRTYFGEPLR